MKKKKKRESMGRIGKVHRETRERLRAQGNKQMAVFILEDALSVWTNFGGNLNVFCSVNSRCSHRMARLWPRENVKKKLNRCE